MIFSTNAYNNYNKQRFSKNAKLKVVFLACGRLGSFSPLKIIAKFNEIDSESCGKHLWWVMAY